MAVTDAGYLTLEQLSAYSQISTRQLRRYLRRPLAPLPARRNGRRAIVARTEFDAWWANESRPVRKPLAKAGRTLREIAAEVQAESRRLA